MTLNQFEIIPKSLIFCDSIKKLYGLKLQSFIDFHRFKILQHLEIDFDEKFPDRPERN